MLYGAMGGLSQTPCLVDVHRHLAPFRPFGIYKNNIDQVLAYYVRVGFCLVQLSRKIRCLAPLLHVEG
jgi:hypothetical protein